MGTGASARSSIVRCQENSMTSGKVTAMILSRGLRPKNLLRNSRFSVTAGTSPRGVL